MKEFAKPKNQKAEVLLELIIRPTVTFSQFYQNLRIINPRARISDLRKHGLEIKCEHKSVRNKHGRAVSYGVWHIPRLEKDRAVRIYEEINR